MLFAMTTRNQLGVAYNTRLVESFAKYVAPSLGWVPNNATVAA